MPTSGEPTGQTPMPPPGGRYQKDKNGAIPNLLSPLRGLWGERVSGAEFGSVFSE